MTDIRVTPMAPRHFGVQVTEGTTTTSHRVALTGRVVDDLALDLPVGDEDEAGSTARAERVVYETMQFLLEREPATAILPEFDLDDVDRYFPGFRQELTSRLSSGLG